MSAAEKLKALLETPTSPYDAVAVKNALPQIVAVIVEAERQVAEAHPDDVDLELAAALVLLAGVLDA